MIFRRAYLTLNPFSLTEGQSVVGISENAALPKLSKQIGVAGVKLLTCLTSSVLYFRYAITKPNVTEENRIPALPLGVQGI